MYCICPCIIIDFSPIQGPLMWVINVVLSILGVFQWRTTQLRTNSWESRKMGALESKQVNGTQGWCQKIVMHVHYVEVWKTSTHNQSSTRTVKVPQWLSSLRYLYVCVKRDPAKTQSWTLWLPVRCSYHWNIGAEDYIYSHSSIVRLDQMLLSLKYWSSGIGTEDNIDDIYRHTLIVRLDLFASLDSV